MLAKFNCWRSVRVPMVKSPVHAWRHGVATSRRVAFERAASEGTTIVHPHR